MNTNPYQSPNTDPSVDISGAGTYQPKVFAAKGRIGRLRYLAYAMASYVFLFPAFIAISLTSPEQAATGELSVASMAIIGVCYLAALVFIACLAVRRFNDMNLTGWWALLLLVPIVNFFADLYLVFGRGTDQSNRFGPAPTLNPLSVKIIGLLLPIIAATGILAAILVPAYVDYTERAQNAAEQY